MKFSNLVKYCFEAGIAPRLERKSFFLCVGKRFGKKDWEWKTEIGAPENNNFLFDECQMCAKKKFPLKIN